MKSSLHSVVLGVGNKFINLLQRVNEFFSPSEPMCLHEWHPCIARNITYNEDKPSRQCIWCKQWQPLTAEQFYAQFGESFYVMVKKQQPAMQQGKIVEEK